MKQKIIQCLKNIGIEPELDEECIGDINLNNCLEDSIQFASFIIEVEDTLGIELPYELLSAEKLESLEGFCSLLSKLNSNADELRT